MNRNAVAVQVTSAKSDLRNEQQVEKREESRGMKDGSGDNGLLFYFIFSCLAFAASCLRICIVESEKRAREKSEERREKGE